MNDGESFNSEERAQENEIKSFSTLQLVLIFPLALIIRLWTASLRFKYKQSQLDRIPEDKKGTLILVWHNRLFVIAELRRRMAKGYDTYGLISASKDGAWLAALYRWLGIGYVRGSSSYRGRAALRSCLGILENEKVLTITPDGPRGPCYKMNPGAVYLAKKTQCPIALISATFSKYHRFKSWDRFYLPFPFSKVEIEIEYYSSLNSLKEANDGVEDDSQLLRDKLFSITQD